MNKSYVGDKQNRSEAGFTLIETTIAMLLMAIVGLGVAACFFYAAKNNSTARDRELSMAVAQQQMEQMRNLKFNDAGLAATVTAGINTNVIRGGRRYQVNTTITSSNVQNTTVRTKRIEIRVVPVSDDWTRNVTSFFGSVRVVCERTSQAVGPNRTF